MFATTVLVILYLSKDATSQSVEALDAFFCDLSTMKYLFLKPDEYEELSVPNIDVVILRSEDIPISELMPSPYIEPNTKNDLVATDFNVINKVLLNISSDIGLRYATYNDDNRDVDFDEIPQSRRAKFRYDQFIYNHTVDIALERSKISKVLKLQLQYLELTRRKVEQALEHRKPSRNDKRYRIGYLFNRLRRLNTEQLKLVTAARMQKKQSYFFNIRSLLRMYEKVVRYDVDVKDTVDLIRTIFAEPAKFDSYARPPKTEVPKY